ncbi:MAG: hypothetical protein VB934_19080 [Polyangiaceae bacterium]
MHDLGVIDAFHLRVHQRMVARAGLHNVCALVCEIDGRVDRERLQARLGYAVEHLPELRWRCGQRRGLWPIWREGPTEDPSASWQSTDHVLCTVMQMLEQPLDRLWSVDVLSGEEHDTLVFRWFHSLTDARGATRFVKWLGHEDEPLPDAGARYRNSDRFAQGLGWKRQLQLLRRYAAHIDTLSARPIMSLDTIAGQRDPGVSRALRMCWDEEQTRAFDRSVRRRAKLADTSVIVWAAARLLDRLQARRGYSAPRQIIPVPMSWEPKGETARMFGNELTMLMLSLDREEWANERTAIDSLARQRREIIKLELDRAAIVAMRLARPLPSPIHHWLLTRKFNGERASQVVSNPGRIEIDTFFGSPVRDAYPVPVAVVPPGLQIVTSRHRGRLGVSVIYRDKIISEAELRAEWESFARDLRGENDATAPESLSED